MVENCRVFHLGIETCRPNAWPRASESDPHNFFAPWSPISIRPSFFHPFLHLQSHEISCRRLKNSLCCESLLRSSVGADDDDDSIQIAGSPSIIFFSSGVKSVGLWFVDNIQNVITSVEYFSKLDPRHFILEKTDAICKSCFNNFIFWRTDLGLVSPPVVWVNLFVGVSRNLQFVASPDCGTQPTFPLLGLILPEVELLSCSDTSLKKQLFHNRHPRNA